MKQLCQAIIVLSLVFFSGCSQLNGASSEQEKKLPNAGENDAAHPQSKDNSKKETAENIEAPQTGGKKDAPKTGETTEPELWLEAKYWNIVEVHNGMKVIMNPDNILVLVNKEQSLPSTYKPNDLVVPRVPFSFAEKNVDKRYMRAEAAAALEALFAAARKEGIDLVAASGYRSYVRQQAIFTEEVKEKGREKAVQAVALPGQSEHQTGLAMDITSPSVDYALTTAFGETKEGKWVAEHAHEYGFIIRYPKGKEAVTGYQYEPWHLRYVGKKAAKVIFERNITLEEYFKIVKKI
ncbi:D-Ala-D-Ala carboxypeptidase VanY [Geobacillus sp. 44B]|jgi:zinc D-Ala-D-Ala carboxypeptidase|uniref:D-Ala-D-Ala carboxypeptidase VanY n=1 Tax=Saccharococcus caldoxylosilyticus TaxID=81408 RepID=UPI0002E18FB5|nr:D-Ala-D-Ala carboxypeptidase VanY [Parageobacillus caldoxylosilyticus]OQP02487.1 D-Ala-D-Ala carboxypeptidase VanY [Geobacillus sp. 44B]QNU37366.1 D-Ala-D-Ala carboxypeptidase VanY [Geobacillus sp. 44B]BDG39422.1 putative carboxypeptidase YodJ [Parageobacillus caldoxylosilyticus]BDG43205.1 putative carboxypeptidase YodJ [Parageobacillus caldoxylosilyticus]